MEEAGKERKDGAADTTIRSGKSCKGTLYYSSVLKSKGRNPRCFGLGGTIPQVPRFVVGKSEVLASKEGRSLTQFRYACVGFSVYPESKDASTDDKIPRPELPMCNGIELLVDIPDEDHAPVPAPAPASAHAHHNKGDDGERKNQEIPQPQPYKPTQPTGFGEEFLHKFTRNASLVAAGVAKNVRKVGNHIKDSVDDMLYPYRRRPK